jgi:hypothetical protein
MWLLLINDGKLSNLRGWMDGWMEMEMDMEMDRWR